MRFQTLRTPNPNERKFVVLVDDQKIKPDQIPTIGLSYANWQLPGKDRLDIGWESYIYLEPMDTGLNGQSGFIFGKAHTDIEKAIPFRSYTTYERYTWPAVLSALGILLDASSPIQFYTDAEFSNLQSRPRPFVRAFYQPEVTVDSEVLVEEYLSSTPYSANQMMHNQPVPSEVSWDVLGSQGSFQKCLHPEIEFEELQMEAQVLSRMGTKNAIKYFGSGKRQKFPGTNYTTWAPFVLSDEQRYVEGQYHRVKRTIYPPKNVTFLSSAV